MRSKPTGVPSHRETVHLLHSTRRTRFLRSLYEILDGVFIFLLDKCRTPPLTAVLRVELTRPLSKCILKYENEQYIEKAFVTLMSTAGRRNTNWLHQSQKGLMAACCRLVGRRLPGKSSTAFRVHGSLAELDKHQQTLGGDSALP